MRQRFIEWIFVLVVLIPAVLLAQWDTSLFDGESKHWGHGYERGQQCYSAIVERAKIAWGNSWSSHVADITLRHWGSSWTLKEEKAEVKAILGSAKWVDMSKMTDGTFDGYFGGIEHDANFINNNAHFPLLYKSNLLENAGAPINFFDEHPHWGAVTHSNGWQYLDDVLNEMVVVQNNNSHSTNEVWATNEWEYAITGSGDTWDEAVENAENNYSDGQWNNADMSENDEVPYQEGWWYASWRDCYAEINDVRERLEVTNSYLFEADWSGYMFATIPDGFVTDDTAEWGDYGTGLTNTYTEYWTATLSTNTGTTTSWLDPDMPGTWPAEPDPNDSDKSSTIRGCYPGGPLELWRFDTPNGFKYVK